MREKKISKKERPYFFSPPCNILYLFGKRRRITSTGGGGRREL
jgi:hypothetical protein